MARRAKTNVLEDLIAVFALLPWWGCLTVAGLGYVVLHAIAAQPAALSLTPDQVPRAMFGSMFKALALIGQFLVPLAGVIAAGVSVAGRRRRSALVATVAQSRAPDALHGMSWGEFEHLVGEGFRLQGYSVLETGGNGPDGGVDLVLSRRGEKYLVQCKQWKAFKVGVEIVRELYGVMAARGVAGGFVVTSGRFTAEATAFAAGRNVQLVDGTKLFAMLQQAEGITERRQVAAKGATTTHSAGAAGSAESRYAVRGRASFNVSNDDSDNCQDSDLAVLPCVCGRDGEPHRPQGRQCRQRVLGLLKLPGMQRDAGGNTLKTPVLPSPTHSAKHTSSNFGEEGGWMVKRFAGLRSRMAPEALVRSEEKARAMLAEMSMNALHQARGSSQNMSVNVLDIPPPSTAKPGR